MRPNGSENFKMLLILQATAKSDHRVKLSEIWDSRVVVQLICGTIGLVAFKVILGSYCALAINFENTDSKNLALLLVIH